MIKGSILFTGQYIATTANSGAPLVDNGNSLGFGLYNSEVNSSSSLTISTTLGVIGGATVTPVAGTYLVIASANLTASSAGGNTITFQLYVGGTAQADTKRSATPLSSAALATFQNMSISTNKLITVSGSQAIALQASTSAGTVTVTGLNFDVIRIA